MAKHGSRKEAWAPEEPPIASEHRPDFVSSFRPIVLCFKLFGFDIDWSSQQPTNCRLPGYFYRFIWLLINMSVVGYQTYVLYRVNYKIYKHGIFHILVQATTIFQISGVYVSLVLAAWKDGGQLAESLRRIETRMPMSKGMLKKIRIASIASVVAATIMVKSVQFG